MSPLCASSLHYFYAVPWPLHTQTSVCSLKIIASCGTSSFQILHLSGEEIQAERNWATCSQSPRNRASWSLGRGLSTVWGSAQGATQPLTVQCAFHVWLKLVVSLPLPSFISLPCVAKTWKRNSTEEKGSSGLEYNASAFHHPAGHQKEPQEQMLLGKVVFKEMKSPCQLNLFAT